jgi:hypothetical protein
MNQQSPGGQLTRAEIKRRERLHILATLAEYGPMTGLEVVRRANGECAHEALEMLSDLTNRGIAAKLDGLWSRGLAVGEHHGGAQPIVWRITEVGRRHLAQGLAALGQEDSHGS